MELLLPRLISSKYGVSGFFCKLLLIVTISLTLPTNASAEFKISFFGDSLVQGFGLYPEDGIVSQMQEWLDQRKTPIILTNSGVSGDTTAGGKARINWTLQEGFDGIIILLGGNDLLRGIDVGESRNNLRAILEVTAESKLPTLLIGHEAPSNYGQDYKAEFEQIYQDLSNEFDIILFPRIFDPIDKLGSREEVREIYFQDDLLHPNREGVHKIVNELGPYVLELIQVIKESRQK
ncbi:MAG: arylesterase [Rhodobacteraceae bacterium]|nr:arylesterase [Paracoccaceae bacterium]MYG41739.1 arylesterase [Paracoccaceae bacterium]